MKPKDRIMYRFQTNCKTLKQTTISDKTFFNTKNKPESQLMRFQNSPPNFMNSFSNKVLLQFFLHIDPHESWVFVIIKGSQ